MLEIGTGTGWNTALLAHRLGIGQVTSIEIDPALAEHARTTLSTFGLPVTVLTGDGEHPPLDPDHPAVDRVLATASCHTLPQAWIQHCAPGGVIVTPWRTHYLTCALLQLTVAADHTASGRFTNRAAFMPLRAHRVGPWIPDPDHAPADPSDTERTTTLHPTSRPATTSSIHSRSA